MRCGKIKAPKRRPPARNIICITSKHLSPPCPPHKTGTRESPGQPRDCRVPRTAGRLAIWCPLRRPGCHTPHSCPDSAQANACNAFASGQAALASFATAHLVAGDHVVVSRGSYGGTFRYFTKVLASFGVSFSWVDTTDLDATRAAITPATRLLFVETPATPTRELSDLAALAALAREATARNRAKVRLAVDNTFATPLFQRPLALGADAVLHSTTKYLNGHSDSLGGAVVSATAEDGARVAFVQNAAGAILSPFDAFLVTRGIKTLAVRMRAHDANGRAVAAFLAAHPKVRRVLYPGLATHPQHALASRQMSGFGGMLALDLGSYDAAKRFLDALRLFTLAESLGGVESLAGHPASMSHGSLGPDERAARGITDGLVRLSCGIEETADLVADVERGLGAV